MVGSSGWGNFVSPVMNVSLTRLCAALAVVSLMVIVRPALANSATFSGNGNNSSDGGFEGGVGSGSLSVMDDGSGGVQFSFSLGDGVTWSQLAGDGNDLVIYIDNGTHAGIASSSVIYDGSTDSGREAVTQNNGQGSASILDFNGLMEPEYAIDFLTGFGGYGQIYQIDQGPDPEFLDGTQPGTSSTDGLTYAVSGSTATIDIPGSDMAADLGLSAFSGATLDFLGMEVSETGYSSSEATVPVSGTAGWNNSQTAEEVDMFAVASVPEGSSLTFVVAGAVVLVLVQRRRLRRL